VDFSHCAQVRNRAPAYRANKLDKRDDDALKKLLAALGGGTRVSHGFPLAGEVTRP
jgi:hypothetical protein